MVPVVVRLEKAGVCGCGAVVAAGERAGTTRRPGRIVCLTCLATFSAKPDDEVAQDAPEEQAVDEKDDQADDEVAVPELRPPAAVLIPADWASPDPISLPAWQRSAGVAVALPPPTASAAARPPAPDAPAVAPVQPAVPKEVSPATAMPAPVDVAVPPPPPPVAEVTTPHAHDVVADELAVAVEAVAMTVPSHRRRTLLPAGLLALQASRGRQPGPTGQSDSTVRALLDAAADAGVRSLHDRRMPGRRGRIAHLAIGPGGVYVIDVVRARNASVVARVVDELDPDTHELLVGGRPMPQAVAANQGRAAIVRAVLDDVELTTVPTTGVVCFVDAVVPRDPELEVGGVRVVGRTGLAALVASDGSLDQEHLDTLVEYLTERLPA